MFLALLLSWNPFGPDAFAGVPGPGEPISDDQIDKAAAAMSAATGVDACPEAGAAWAAIGMLRERGWLTPSTRTLVFNTGTGLKYR